MQKRFSSIYFFKVVAIRAVIVYSLCCLQTAQAQKYGFRHFTTDDGLAQSQVTAMCQDNYGYLWFSTYGGVSRFDGIEFNTLYNNRSSSLFKDSKGRLWVGWQGGVSVYEKGEFKAHSFSDEQLSGANITAIAEQPLGSYWLLSDKRQLVNISKGDTTIYSIADTLAQELGNMTITSDNTIHIATNNGIIKFDQKTRHFSAEKIFDDVSSCSHILFKDGRFYISTYGFGIFVYDEKGREITNLTKAKDKLTTDVVRHLFFDSEGILWASTADGVNIIDKKFGVTPLQAQNGLPYSNITFTGQDNEGNIWFGASGGGIIKFIGKEVINYDHTAMSILQDRNSNTYWIAAYNDGVYSFKDGDFKHYNNDLSDLAGDIVWSLAQTPDGKIWMGTSNGLSVLDPKKDKGKVEKSYFMTDSLLDNKITSLYVDKRGILWIGSRGGLNSFYNGKFESYNENANITGGNIRCILPGKKGDLWLAGSAGLFRFDVARKQAKLYRFKSVNEGNTVYCIRFDYAGNLWVGTEDGVYLLKNEKLVRLKKTNMEISGNVNFLMDDQDKLWIGNNFGVFELDLKEYYAKDTAIMRSYGSNEGMISRETNLNAVYKDRYDNLWFGTDKGLVRIGKKRFHIDTKSPPFVHIDNVQIFLKKPDWKKFSSHSLNDFGFPAVAEKIKYNQNHLTFYFTGISHTQPQNIRYRYMLEGFDSDWLPVTETRSTTYSNLPPGTYRFKVMAQNANGLWSEKPSVFDFTIIAPFWRTWWFYSLCLGVFILIIIGLWRLRLSQIKRKNQTMQLYYKSKLLSLEQQSLNASMNRHFIFNSLNSIQYYINKQDKLEANRYLTNFAKLIRKNLDSAISSDLIPLAEELDRIQLYLSLETMRFKDRFIYTFNINENIDPQSILIPPMLFQPYIENSIWHGILPKEEIGELQVNIYPNPDDATLVNIEILDDGIGLSNSLKNKVDTGSTHISRGIEITSGRLNLLKKMTSQNLEIIGPMDITDASGKVTGTLVKLVISVKIPLKIEKTEDKLYEK